MAAEDYVGPVGHEKKFHKTHFGVDIELKTHRKLKPIDQDSNWKRIGPGRYRWVGKVKHGRKKEGS